MEIAKVGVIGAGVMGAGIAQRCATHSYRAVLVDARQDQLLSASARIKESLDKLVKRGVLAERLKEEILKNIELAPDLSHVADCDLTVEAVNEDPELKKNVFRELDRICSPQTILASNTSSIPISLLAGATGRPEKVIGLHFMNPVPLSTLAELIRAGRTSAETMETCKRFAQSLALETVESADTPGFIINRVLMPMINEAAHALAQGVAGAEDIDRAMVLGTRQPMGPLALADLIGLDVVLSIIQTLHRETKQDRFKPCPLLEDHVRQNRLGRKTGRGFHTYA